MPGTARPALMLTTVLPGALRSGGEIVSQAIVDALGRAGFTPTVVGYRRPGDDGPAGAGEVAASIRPIETQAAGRRAGGWMAKAVLSGIPYSVAKYRSRGYLRAVDRGLAENPSAVLVDHAQVAFALPRIQNAPLVYVAHNAESRIYRDLAASADRSAARWAYRRESRLLQGIERELVQRATQVWSLSGEDRDALRTLCPHADIRLLEVASGLDVSADRAVIARQADPGYDVALIGNWGWRPNGRGLEWFVSEVASRMDPGVSIAVAGAGADWLRGHRQNIEVLGPVTDAAGFLVGARVVAIPAVTGGGVQVKTLDAIATGLPVVVTSTATRGLGKMPRSVAVSDTAEAFAANLSRAAQGAPGADLRDEAIRWSHRRRTRFAAGVVEGIRDAVEAGRSGSRTIREAATTG